MAGTGFWWILLAAALYGVLHSILAAHRFKDWAARLVGPAAYRRFYRLFYVIAAVVTFLPVLGLAALLPDRLIYTIPAPWVYVTTLVQGLALAGIAWGVIQTGALAFLGLRQLWDGGAPARAEKLVTGGLFGWVRHPLYTFSFLLLWLMPVMSWNLLAMNLALSAYMLIGSVFEERKLAQEFGDAYVAYRKKTPRILPQPWRRR